jgi:hypothetical protein
MKKYITPIAMLLALLLLCAAEWAPLRFTYGAFTKRIKYSVKNLNGVTAQTSNASTVYLNGVGDGWPLAAGATQDILTRRGAAFRNTSTLVFTCVSTAAGSATKLYIQEL